MRLQYNIYLELAAAVFTIFIAIYLKLQYSLKLLRNKLFFAETIIVTVTSVLDVVSAITISYSKLVPVWINLIINSMYFMSIGTVSFVFIYYALSFDSPALNRSRPNLAETLIFIAYIVIMASNEFTGWVIYFDDSRTYVHGPLYYLVYIVPYFFFTMSFIYLLKVAVTMGQKEIVSIIMYFTMGIVGTLVQLLLIPNVLINVFTISVGIVILMFSLETPEYEKLNDTMVKLRQATETAQFANQSKSRFLANMSHEIRTPINAILGMNEMILRESDDPEIIDYANDIAVAGESLMSVVNDILDISRIESGKMEIVVGKYRLSDLLEECIILVEQRARSKELKFEYFIEQHTPNNLVGDESRIKEVVINLLTNAIKYTKEGTITLRVKWQNTNESGIKLIISVEDTGIGIEEENIPNLFQSYERLDSQKNKGIEGTGLGLAISKQLVELMGGDIGVHSEYGKGSLFYFELPQELYGVEEFDDTFFKENAKNKNSRERREFIAENVSILVADDVRVNLKVIEKLLKHTRIQIDLAEGGQECIDMAYQKKYDLILLDHLMPGVDGVQALVEIRKPLCVNADTKVVAMTANAMNGMKEQYIDIGFDDYLSKPISGERLEEMIEKYVKVEYV